MSRIILSLILVLVSISSAFAKDYVIGEGDSLNISVWGEDKMNAAVTVRPDGKISTPGAGDILASGKTPQELEAIITDSLRKLFKYEPLVTVAVISTRNNSVYIYGGGVEPSVYELSQKTSLLQLLCTIKDVKYADLTNAYVLRNGQKVKENFFGLLQHGDTSDNIWMEANDSVFIPPFKEHNVYVLGAVMTPKYIQYRDGMTVMEAILEAGGFNKFANENQTVVARHDDGKVVYIPVKAKDLIRDGDLGQNVLLRSGDYVIVKESIF